jgi:ABC-type nitrate/sulfonate/bicarbonate transport system substrate-binding protein
MKKLISLIMMCLLVIGLTACSGGNSDKKESQTQTKNAKGPQKVTVMLDWTPNTNHTGLYVAQAKGYFKQQGLDVKILQPSQSGTDQLVAAGKADFGVSFQEDVTKAQSQGIPLVSIAAIIQHNTSAFASLEKENITSVKDFEGKTYGGWGTDVETAILKSVMKKNGADSSKVNNLTLGDTDFLKSIGRQADFEWIYYGWEGIEAELKGEKLNLIWLKDLDPKLDFYSPVIVTNENHIKNQPKLVKKFMTAVSEGYNYSIKHPQESANILLKNAPELNKQLVVKSQKWLSPRYQADAPQWGYQKASVWKNFIDWAYQNGVIKKKVDPSQAFTNDFLPKSGS